MDVAARLPALLAAMGEFDLTELDITIGSERLAVRRPDPSAGQETTTSGAERLATAGELDGHAIRSPVAGTYYATSRPGADPYVRKGDFVTVGQVIGLVEAMKVFNEITADRAGRVIEILLRGGDQVAVEQPLVLLDVDAQVADRIGELRSLG